MGSFRSGFIAFTGKHEGKLRERGLFSIFSSLSFLISAAQFTKRSLMLKDEHFLLGNYKIVSLFDNGQDGGGVESLAPNTIVSSKIHSLENAMSVISINNSSKGNRYLLECYSGIGRDEINELASISKELMLSKESNSYTKRFVSCVSFLSERGNHKTKGDEIDRLF